MQTRQLGKTDMQITPLGLGTWAIGGGGWQFGWGPQDDEASVAAIHRALDLGINWIDTAAVYGLGHSQEGVARALAGWSDRESTRLNSSHDQISYAGFCFEKKKKSTI